MVLVVDDEPSLPRLFDQRFRKEIREGELAFVYAATAEQALELLDGEAAAADLILSDVNMPGMTGLDFLDALGLRSAPPPVYIVSAYDGAEFEAQARARGAAGFLPKPLRFDLLQDLFRRASPLEAPP